MLTIKKYFALFIIYSFIGWLMEVILTLIKERKIINRGFLIGPYCPIYGTGCLLLITLLNKYKNDPLTLFIMTVLVCSILEYTTSYVMEKLFKARWWDYTRFKFNINGRICAETMIPFGILGVLVIYYLNPFLLKIINTNTILFTIMTIIFITDVSISFGIITSLKTTINDITKDSTEEITKRVREILKQRSYFHKRLIKAFPNFKSPIDILKDIVKR